MLLEANADVNIKDNVRVTFHVHVQYLLYSEYYLNMHYSMGVSLVTTVNLFAPTNTQLKKTPLMVAAESGNHSICQVLLSRGADPSNVDDVS